MQRDAWDSCTYCHGIDGAVHDPTVPAIAGQSAAYLRKQLGDFRAGKRIDQSGMMTSALFLLEPTDDAIVARYFADKPRPNRQPIDTPSGSSIGKKLFMQGQADTPACQGCHGDQARRVNATYPALHGLSAGYIARQLKRFRAGERTNDPGGIMRSVAQPLSNEEIDAVADYIDHR